MAPHCLVLAKPFKMLVYSTVSNPFGKSMAETQVSGAIQRLTV